MYEPNEGCIIQMGGYPFPQKHRDIECMQEIRVIWHLIQFTFKFS